MTNRDLYNDDASHPIPYVNVLDIRGDRKDGGIDLVIVVAPPLKADERSIRRVVQKMRNYLGFAKLEKGNDEWKPVRIIVDINADSDEVALKYLSDCSGWVSDNGAELIVRVVKRDTSKKY